MTVPYRARLRVFPFLTRSNIRFSPTPHDEITDRAEFMTFELEPVQQRSGALAGTCDEAIDCWLRAVRTFGTLTSHYAISSNRLRAFSSNANSL
jgi:hypothetical protein